MRKKWNIETIKSEFNKEGYKLLSNEYTKRKDRNLKYKCNNGHTGITSLDNWLKGCRCNECGIINRTKNLRNDINNIKLEFEREGYVLLSEDYKNSTETKLKYKCPNGHIGYIRYNDFMKGHRCKKCYDSIRGDSSKNKIENIRESFNKEGYELLSDSYVNAFQKLKYKCPCGHIGYIRFNNWNNGQRCNDCSVESRKDKLKLDLKYIRESFNKEGYKILSDNYINQYQKLFYVCTKNHIGTISWNNWRLGHRCAICSNRVSKPENYIYELIKRYFPDAEHNVKSYIHPYELDIVIPSKKVAIEYCGLHWHSQKSGNKDRNYHLNKLNMCNNIGYDLVTIFEDEWIYRKKVCISRLLNKLGVNNSERIFARKCKVKEVDYKTCSEFLNTNHLQGKDNAPVRLGLFYNDRLVSVMTFSKCSISKGGKPNSKEYELNRFCSDYRVHVIGGANKLFKYFIRNYDFHRIVSFGDRRWSNGLIYKILGFEREKDSSPNYWYIIGDKRSHRYTFRKSILKNKLEYFNSDLTEWKNMTNNGYDRIWDCGNSKWSYDNEY